MQFILTVWSGETIFRLHFFFFSSSFFPTNIDENKFFISLGKEFPFRGNPMKHETSAFSIQDEEKIMTFLISFSFSSFAIEHFFFFFCNSFLLQDFFWSIKTISALWEFNVFWWLPGCVMGFVASLKYGFAVLPAFQGESNFTTD